MSQRTLRLVIAAAIVLAVAFVLNPSADKHRATIKDRIAERSQLERALGVGAISAFAARYSSLGVASYTTINGELSSIGVFGLVFVTQ